jgi:hypothetical protein
MTAGIIAGCIVGGIALALTSAREGTPPQRSRLMAGLSQNPGRDLVIVRYLPNHPLDEEWVYNSADIDAQPIVWAHDMGDVMNRTLLGYFADRTVWLATIGVNAARYDRIRE